MAKEAPSSSSRTTVRKVFEAHFVHLLSRSFPPCHYDGSSDCQCPSIIISTSLPSGSCQISEISEPFSSEREGERIGSTDSLRKGLA